MKITLIIIITLHGLIHLMGFIKAFSFAEVQQLSRYISRPLGIIWLITAILFFLVAVLIIMNKSWWSFFAIAAVILSQTLIFIFWSDAKFGTILNIVVLIAAVQALGSYQFNKMVDKEVRKVVIINPAPVLERD